MNSGKPFFMVAQTNSENKPFNLFRSDYSFVLPDFNHPSHKLNDLVRNRSNSRQRIMSSHKPREESPKSILIRQPQTVQNLQDLQNFSLKQKLCTPQTHNNESQQLYFSKNNSESISEKRAIKNKSIKNSDSSQSPNSARKLHVSPLSRQIVSINLKNLQEKMYNFQYAQDNRFEILFSSQQSTLNASFAKDESGILLKSPVQRIGLFQQNKAHFRLSHLFSLIDGRGANHKSLLSGQQVEIPIQLCFEEKKVNSMVKHRHVFDKEDVEMEPVSISVYPQCIHGYEGEYQNQCLKYMSKLLKQMNNFYDPSLIGKNFLMYKWNPSEWSREDQKIYLESSKRYKAYCGIGEEVFPWSKEDIFKFNKEWIFRASTLVSRELILQNKEYYRVILKEIVKNYKIGIKMAILNYILLSESERERLKIRYLPIQYPTSFQRIISQGGYSRKIYQKWYLNVKHNKQFCEGSLQAIYTPVQKRALIDWFYSFEHYIMFELDATVKLSKIGLTLSPSDFCNIQHIFRTIVKSQLLNVWFRGCIVILKKFQFLIPSGQVSSKLSWLLDNQVNTLDLKNYSASKLSSDQLFDKNIDAWYYYFKASQCGGVFQNQIFDKNLDIRSAPTFPGYEYACRKNQKLNEDSLENYEQARNKKVLYSSIARNNGGDQDPYYVEFSLAFAQWEDLKKPYRKAMKRNLKTIFSLQLRYLLRKSLYNIIDFFEGYPIDYDKEYVQKLKGMYDRQQQYLQQLEQQEKKNSPAKNVKNTKEDNQDKKNIKQNNKENSEKKQDQQPKVPENLLLAFAQKLKTEPLEDCFNVHGPGGDYNQTPLLKLELGVQEQVLKFDHDQKEIYHSLKSVVKESINVFDSFYNPDHVSLKEQNKVNPKKTKLEEIVKNMLYSEEKNFNQFSTQVDEMYQSYVNQYYIQLKTPNHSKLQAQHPGRPIPILIHKWEQQQLLSISPFLDPEIKEFLIQLKNQIRSHYEQALLTISLFWDLQIIIKGDAQNEIQTVCQQPNIINQDLSDYLEVLKKLENYNKSLPDYISFTLFKVVFTPAKNFIFDEIRQMRTSLCQLYEKLLLNTAISLHDRYMEINLFIRKVSHNVEDAVVMEKFMYDVYYEIIQLSIKSTTFFQNLMFFITCNQIIGVQLINLTKEIYRWPQYINKELPIQEEKRTQEKLQIQVGIKNKKVYLSQRSEELSKQIQQYQNLSEYSKYQKYLQMMEEYIGQLQLTQKEMKEIKEYELNLYGKTEKDNRLVSMIKEMNPYYDMWKSIASFSELKKLMMTEPIIKLDPHDLEIQLRQHQKTSLSLWNNFKPESIAFRVSNEFKDELQFCMKLLPLVEMLTKQGMQARHWEAIEKLLNTSVEPSTISVKELLRYNVDQFFDVIEEISDNAQKEYGLESAIIKMEKEWESMKFQLGKWKNREIKVFQGQNLEDIQLLLDDHTIKASMIRSNPSIKFMEEKAIEWEKQMIYIQEVLEVWVKVQGMYVYLEPIFTFEDINKSLGSESMKFQIVNKMWWENIRTIERNPLVLNVYKIPGLLPNLKESLEIMEHIQKALEHHLEIKRIEFPRFFFLSNDELISTLAEARDPVHVQHHLKKCFEGVDTLIFGLKETEITGVRSRDKEEVRFNDKVNTKDFRSNIEKWLMKVDESIKKNLAKMFESCINDLNKVLYKSPRRQDWLFRHLGQSIMCISSIFWAQKTEEALRHMDNEPNALKDHYKIVSDQLEEIVTLVRGRLNDLQRVILGTQIVLEVHQKDIVEELVFKSVTSSLSFEWQAQMRYYWFKENRQIQVRMIQSWIYYGYEYLGTITRLVQTPLTDRCFRTMMQAVNMNLGGAPEGPAGTGKTESIKDLSKAVAVQCIVFNCSEGLNVLAMSNFFKGMSAGGAWSCFDEFNRIDVEVLSVLASQILNIQQAKDQKKNVFVFEGTQLKFNSDCNIFITMNPGYAGRSELPDNLKALFRPCAMMVPDLAMIAEISLYSYGFLEARHLAKKIISVYKLCSEQLSQQGHYDYGMRAVKAALIAAYNLKRKDPKEREEYVILRAICDINVPKFITQDQILFNGIISDLFPNQQVSTPRDQKVEEILKDTLQTRGYQYIEAQIIKLYFLWEMMSSRHGIMLVGDAMTGKTTILNLMTHCMNQLNKKVSILGRRVSENSVWLHVINPKAMNINQLFGKLDMVTKEWTEGVLGEVYRKCANSTGTDKQIILLDGPVDADWIENLNTVLDDNKKLCLLNGDVLLMSQYMSIFFEVPDLQQASPATISRCGMIYFPENTLGWDPLYKSFMQNFKTLVDESIYIRFEELFDGMIESTIKFINDKLISYQPLPPAALIQNILRLLKDFLQESQLIHVKFNEGEVEQIPKFDSLWIFVLYQAVSGNLDQNSKRIYETQLRKVIKETIYCKNLKVGSVRIDKASWPPEGLGVTLQELYYDFQEGLWKNWRDTLENVDQSLDSSILFIDTVETQRLKKCLQFSINNHQPFLAIGPSGTGKTMFMTQYLRTLPSDKHVIVKVLFSYQTQPSKIQETVENKIERKRKGVMGPVKIGQKCQIFIDDLNIPAKDKYGDQAPIELLRQFCDYHGWYAKDRKFMEIVDTNLIGVMSPPGGGRNTISNRLVRHFNIQGLIEPDAKNLHRIYFSLINVFCNQNFEKADVCNDIKQVYSLTVDASIELYTSIQMVLKPTPAKSHYLFNLRNLSNIYQGMQLAPPTLYAQNYRMIYKLWLHEVTRVFLDRLYENEDDLHWFLNTLQMLCRSKLREEMKDLVYLNRQPPQVKNLSMVEMIRQNIFMDLFSQKQEQSQYIEQKDYQNIIIQAERYLEDYNINTKKPLNLILFDYAIDHLLHILRILKMKQGHLLLVGLGGSGRQSLTRLASEIRGYQCMQIELTKFYDNQNWVEDLQKLIIISGVERKKIVFLISDFQIKSSYVLENLNSLLNSGEVPNLFKNEDMVTIIDQVRLNAKKDNKSNLTEQGTQQELYDYMIETSISNLHIVLALSPVGDQFRSRVRIYPNIVNCTTIDWFKQWPEDALMTVAQKFISELYIDKAISSKQLSNFCIYMHTSCIQLSRRYQQCEGRYNYVTPNSYLELMKLFKLYLHTTQTKLQENKNIYSNGVQKIKTTQRDVKIMGEELVIKKEKLTILNKDTQKIADEIQQQAQAMEPKKKKIEIEEQLVNQRVKEAEQISIECEHDLSIARPKLKQAQDALNTLDPNDINNIKVMLKPPETVQLVMEAICVMIQVPPIMIQEGKSKKIPSYWEASKKLLSDRNFLNQLINYNKDNIPDHVISKVRANYISKTEIFNAKRVEKASSAAKGLCEWILAIDEYEKVLKMIRPKIASLTESKQQVVELQGSLQKTRDELYILNTEIQRLQKQYNLTKEKQQKLEDEINDCERKVIRASSLIQQLETEQVRWSQNVVRLEGKLQFVIGDTLLSSGIIAYLGPFSVSYRNKQILSWIDHLKQIERSTILISDHYSLEATIGDQILIRKWTLNGLPLDSFSRENAIITYYSQRWPLLIDPQGQANKWIKLNELENKVIASRQTEPEFVKHLENAIQFGFALVIENVEQDVDASLDSLLLKQTFRLQGVTSIKIGENIIPYSKFFKMFLTSKMANPHFPPEVSTKVTLVNFTITAESLEAQLLELCVKSERPELEETRQKLILKKHENERQLENIEQQILQILNQAENILDDEKGIETLKQSKKIAFDTEEENKISVITERKIEEARVVYKPIAIHSCVLFFCSIGMASQDTMYQFSLKWFIQIYDQCLQLAEQSKQLKQRIDNVICLLTQTIYANVCRALFERHKILFSLLLTVKIMESKKQIVPQELQYLLQSNSIDREEEAKLLEGQDKRPDYLTFNQWVRTCQASLVSRRLWQVKVSLVQSPLEWSQILRSKDPFSMEYPEPVAQLTSMQKLCIVKALKPESLLRSLVDFIGLEMGDEYTRPHPFNLSASFNESQPQIPLIFVLPGNDPFVSLQILAESKQQKLKIISLGQGQGKKAERAIDESKQTGDWVLLQNCHLAPSWMPTLERICEEMEEMQSVKSDTINQTFRLWLTSYPSTSFPLVILQNGIKMTNEPPKGLKANLLMSYTGEKISDPNFFELQIKPKEFKTLLFGLCFFHAVIQERKTYGYLGFNCPYSFTQSDLRISIQQLEVFCKEYHEVPYKTLNYLVTECNYGGRVTDEKDRKVIQAIVDDYFSEIILHEGYRFGGASGFYVPEVGAYNTYLRFINNMSKNLSSELIGFHLNADIIKDIKESEEILTNFIAVSFQEQTSNNNKEQDQQQVQKILEQNIKQTIQEIQSKIPRLFEFETLKNKFPYAYNNTMNMVFQSEIQRYNQLVLTIQTSLKEVEAVLKGLASFTDDSENVYRCLQTGSIPDCWRKISYPTLKPLGSYMFDLQKRLTYFSIWSDQGEPSCHWLSGYFYTKAFLTSVLQNHSRRKGIPVDALEWKFECFSDLRVREQWQKEFKEKGSTRGTMTYGLYLEGGKWNHEQQKLEEQDKQQILIPAPYILLIPEEIKPEEDKLSKQYIYPCPVFKTIMRRGYPYSKDYYIFDVLLPSNTKASHWVKRGTALISSLND